MIRKILQALASIIILIIGYYQLPGSEYQKDFLVYGLTGLIGIVILIIEVIVINRKRLGLKIYSRWLGLKGKKIRFSMSYLYRIKIDDKYLLVRNNNFGHYQLVGGKYKLLEGTRSLVEQKFDALGDLKLPTSGMMKDDFALFIPAGKAIKFLDWFNEGKNREVNHWREFYEELIGGKHKLLNKEKFPYVNYNFVGRIRTPIKRTPGWNCYEILQYDILELIPTQSQQTELKELLKKDSKYYKWADEELIQCLGQDNREKNKLYDIGIHTKWALNMKWSKE